LKYAKKSANITLAIILENQCFNLLKIKFPNRVKVNALANNIICGAVEKLVNVLFVANRLLFAKHFLKNIVRANVIGTPIKDAP
jgi:hypothetical protein